MNPKKSYAIDEIERCISTLKMQGLKLHFWNSNINLRKTKHLESVKLVFTKAVLLNIPVLVHLYNGGIKGYGKTDMQLFIRNILSAHSDLRLCFAHLTGAGNFPSVVTDTFEMLIQARENNSQLKTKNLYVDLAEVFRDKPLGSIEGITKEQLTHMGNQLRKWGLDNVLWGSDNIKNYLQKTKSMWPLNDEEYNHIMNNDGRSLLYS